MQQRRITCEVYLIDALVHGGGVDMATEAGRRMVKQENFERQAPTRWSNQNMLKLDVLAYAIIESI